MNLIGRFRSNYFAVKDREGFEQWCQQNGLRMITEKDLVGFQNETNEAGIPTTVHEEEEETEIDFIGELGTFLADGHVAVVFEIYYEGYRYLGGCAFAINARGERRSVDMTPLIMAQASELGEHVTPCEY